MTKSYQGNHGPTIVMHTALPPDRDPTWSLQAAHWHAPLAPNEFPEIALMNPGGGRPTPIHHHLAIAE
jgi:hypothetical protein